MRASSPAHVVDAFIHVPLTRPQVASELALPLIKSVHALRDLNEDAQQLLAAHFRPIKAIVGGLRATSHAAAPLTRPRTQLARLRGTPVALYAPRPSPDTLLPAESCTHAVHGCANPHFHLLPAAGQELCRQGDDADRMWLLASGRLVALRHKEEAQHVSAPALVGDSLLLALDVKPCR